MLILRGLFMGKNQNNNYMFKGFFRPYLEKIKRNILHTFKIDIESFEKLADDIYVNLFKLAVRTLIRELHIYKEKGLLKGETKEARFSYFEMLCEKQEFRDVFFQKYSQLEQILDDYVTCLTRNLIKMISDTIDDRTSVMYR